MLSVTSLLLPHLSGSSDFDDELEALKLVGFGCSDGELFAPLHNGSDLYCEAEGYIVNHYSGSIILLMS